MEDFLPLLLQVIYTVKVGGFRVLSIDHNDLPVCFTLIDQSQSSQHLHFDYFPSRAHLRTKDTFLEKLQTVELKSGSLFKAPHWSRTLFPMSHISIGSLSPQQPVSLSLWFGSSHVCENRKLMFDGAETQSGYLLFEYKLYLWNSSIVPDVAFVRKHIGYITKIPLLHVLFQWIERILGGNLIDRQSHQLQLKHYRAAIFFLLLLFDNVGIKS